MTAPLQLAVIGLGRIGSFHARHAAELAARDPGVQLTAIVDPREDLDTLVQDLARIQGNPVRQFRSLAPLLSSEAVDAVVVASPTRLHDEHTRTLVRAGLRVLLEKTPHSVGGERSLPEPVPGHPPSRCTHARIFSGALTHPCATPRPSSMRAGSGDPSNLSLSLKTQSRRHRATTAPGLLQDMSIHNIDEILWLSGSYPSRVQATGSRVYSHRLTEVEEDFDDALLQLWFPDEVIGQIQVSRNHVAGYRVETWIFGEQGVIHVGAFAQNPEEVVLRAYGRDTEIDMRRFPLRSYAPGSPEFMARFRKRLRVRTGSVRGVLPFRNVFPCEPEARTPSHGGHRGQREACACPQPSVLKARPAILRRTLDCTTALLAARAHGCDGSASTKGCSPHPQQGPHTDA